MIVQANNGKFYKNPKVVHDTWAIECVDDEIIFTRAGIVTWRTARKVLRPGGVNCVISEDRGHGQTILGGQLVATCKFKIILRGPIPIPDTYDNEFELYPHVLEMEGEKVLSWKTGKKSTKTGQPS